MFTEALSIVAVACSASIALVPSKKQPGYLHRTMLWVVVASLLNLVVVGLSGILHDQNDFFASVHLGSGHLVLPLTAAAAGLWLGMSFPRFGQRPVGMSLRVLFLMILCFFCLSNIWTGYLGPSRTDSENTAIRFRILHQFSVPIVIVVLQLIWLRRLTVAPVGGEHLD